MDTPSNLTALFNWNIARSLMGPDLSAHPRDLVPGQVDLHRALRSPGTSPNFRITSASPKSPVAGSPLRLNATAPTLPGLRHKASAFITAEFGLKHSMASPGAMPSSDETNGSAT
jgi:hypothetical protein